MTMILKKDYFDALSSEERTVLRSCGMPLDVKEILDMDDQEFYDLIHADHKELSDDEHNTWLALSYTIKNGITEIKYNRNGLKSKLEKDAKHSHLHGPDPKDGNGNGKGNADYQKEKDRDRNAAQEALALAEERCSELFLDQFGTPYAAVKIGEHIETLRLKDSRFKNWLCRTYYISEDRILTAENVANVMNILKAKAEFEGVTRTLNLRVASVKEECETRYYYDLTNRDWQVVKITEDDWSIEYAPIVFKRYRHQQPQVYPTREYPPDIFDKFMDLLNVKGEDDKLLLECYIVSLFYPDIPKPILMLHGEQGSAKSTLQALIRMLVDPSSIHTLTFPRDINELTQKLSHHYVSYFDNVSTISDWISDELCRGVTGAGFSKRELFTDDDDIIYNFKRCIGFNGINLGGTKQDLLDRGIIIELERIREGNRREEEEIWTEFEIIRPQLLGYISDILVKVLQVKRDGGIKLEKLPRMADFAKNAEIISRCMGHENNAFIETFNRNIRLQVEEAISANLVGNAIVKFMDGLEDKSRSGCNTTTDRCSLLWMGTATSLLTELEGVAVGLKINTNQKSWPKGPNALSRRINEAKTNLREIGIIIDRCFIGDKSKTRGIKICKIPSELSELSETENRAQITSYISDDTALISSEDKVSSEKTPENRAQNSTSDDTDDTDDTLQTLQGEKATITPFLNSLNEENSRGIRKEGGW
jgi:hypothetical protein